MLRAFACPDKQSIILPRVLVAAPIMRNGNFFNQLEHEHIASADSLVPYITPQTKGEAKVVPKVQWIYVIEGREAARTSGIDADRMHDIPGRNGEPLSHYLAKMKEKNALLVVHGHALLVREELITMRLYSGPQYAKCTLPSRSNP